MFIQPETVLRDTAIALVPMVAAGGFIGGWFGVLGTVVTGVFVLANLFVLSRLTRRLTSFLAGQDPQGGLAVGILVAKFPIALGVITLLAWAFDGLSVALGMSAMVSAVFLRGLWDMMSAPAPALANSAPQPAEALASPELPKRS